MGDNKTKNVLIAYDTISFDANNVGQWRHVFQQPPYWIPFRAILDFSKTPEICQTLKSNQKQILESQKWI